MVIVCVAKMVTLNASGSTMGFVVSHGIERLIFTSDAHQPLFITPNFATLEYILTKLRENAQLRLFKIGYIVLRHSGRTHATYWHTRFCWL